MNKTYNEDIVKKNESEILLCRNESKVAQEINQVLHDSLNMNNSETVKALYTKLSDKYRTKRWFTIVYKNVDGFSNHFIDDIFPNSFHQWGKNAFVYSVEADHLNISSTDVKFLDQQLNDAANYWDAEMKWNALNNGTDSRLHLGVIKTYRTDSEPHAYWGKGDANKAEEKFYFDPYYENGTYFTVIALPNSTMNYAVSYNHGKRLVDDNAITELVAL